MKKNYALALLCAWGLAQALPAQDIDRQPVSIHYIRLPLKKLPDHIQTYRATVKPLETSWGNVLGNEYDADKLQLNGYHRSEDATGDLLIHAEVARPLVYDQVQINVFEGKHKPSKDEPEVAYKAYYYTVFFYPPQLKYRLTTDRKKLLAEESTKGEKRFDLFGSLDYANAYKSEKDLTAAWKEQKKEFLANHEKRWFDNLFATLPYALGQYCLVPAVETFKVRYIDEKRTNRYADYREAKDLFVRGVKYAATDRVEKINKLVQADYEKRKDLVRQAITLWEKALEEADYDRKRARVNAKVARNTYYNLALAYAWIDDYDKAREYLQARKEDVGNWDKNLMAGIKELSAFIDAQEVRYRANTWRELLAEDKTPYEFKPKTTEPGGNGNKGNSPKQRGPGTSKSGTKTKTTTSAPGKAIAKRSVGGKRP